MMMNIRNRTATTSKLAVACLALLLLALTSCSQSPGDNDRAEVDLNDVAGTTTATASLPDDDAIREEIDAALDVTERRQLNTQDHAAWQIVHGIMAFGPGFHIEHDGKLVPALDWLLAGGTLNGWNLRPGEKGLEAILEAGSQTGQGHEDQWLGYLSLCGLKADDTLVVRGQKHKVMELATQAMWDLHEGMEASWTLMALSTYLPLDAEWKNSEGETWNLERLVAMEDAAFQSEAGPCGGTHRMVGLTLAVNRYLSEHDGDLNGAWEQADDSIQSSIELAREYQNPDGTFSAEFFKRPSSTADVALKINTTGHTLEFLCYALTQEQIHSRDYDWVERAAVRLADLLDETKELPLECGSLYHAAHALQLYRLRRFGPRVFADQTEEITADLVTPSGPQPASQ